MNLSSALYRLPFINELSSSADEQKVPAYIVGGFVRDTLLRKNRNEVDIMVVGEGTKYAETVAAKLGIKRVSIFRTYGTAHFKYQDYDLEFVGARKESYSPESRNPEVESASFEEDLSRRDFTINTLAVSVNSGSFGEITDLYNGQDDLQNKIIRTPLDPLITFNDDPLRILRAFRFASQLNFEVNEKILIAASELKERLKIVSQERITDEFLKILSSPKPSIGLKYIFETGVLDVIFPEAARMAGVDQREEYHHKDVFYHTLQVVDNVAKNSGDVWLRLAAFVHDIAKPQTKRFVEGTGWTFHGHEEIGARMIKGIFKRLKLPLYKKDYVEKLVRLHLRPIALAKEEVTDSAIRRLIVAAGEDLGDLIMLCRADITSKNPGKVTRYLQNYELVMQKVWEVEEKDKLRAFQSPVKGETIMEVCNLPPSRKVGEIKKAIEEAILDGIIANNYDEAYNYLLKIKDEYLQQK
jgi:poly(A) polymerase